jgi:hypothetical protein
VAAELAAQRGWERGQREAPQRPVVQVLLQREEDVLAAGVAPLGLGLSDQSEPPVELAVGVLGVRLERPHVVLGTLALAADHEHDHRPGS